MSEMVLLADKAHCRFGDKGDTGLFVVIPYEPADFAALVAGVTPARISQHFGHLPLEQIECIPAPQLGALVVVMRQSLGGGVTRSLALDAHGKTRSGYLLGMKVPWPLRKVS
ncbi:MAG: hypothetical protein U0350_35640 [Caldilineaceae bacterium]